MGFLDLFRFRKSPAGPILRRAVPSLVQDRAQEEWRRIEELRDLRRPSALKEAVIRSDKLLDAVLKEMVTGETSGERLKGAQELFSNRDVYQGLWDAHKSRNALVHESGYELTYTTGRKVLDKFQRGFKDLGIKLDSPTPKT